MLDLLRDLRYSIRRLARTPGFTAATILTLALGIGANTAIFSVVYGVLLKPLPFPEPERLIAAWQTAPGVKVKDLNASLADYVMYREESRTFSDAALWSGRSVTVTEFAEPERVDGIAATFRFLPMLGIQPLLGRAFAEKDNDSKSPEVVLLSHGYWQRRFGSDPNVVGRTLRVDGTAREIIGVLPAGVWLFDQHLDLILPLRFDRAAVRLAGYNFQAIARLRPGVTLDQANADVARLIALELQRFPPPPGMSLSMMADARLAPNLRPLSDDLIGDLGRSLWVVMATIGIVLLIACANVANLLLVRTEGRTQEFAVRAALGAGRGRLTREILAESLLLSLAGGAVGLGLAAGLLRLVLSFNTARLPRLELVSVDGPALGFALLVSLAAGIAFGLIPAWRHRAIVVAEALRSGGRTASASRERHVVRNTLTVFQVALALVLLIGSGLMIRTFLSLRAVDPGFHGDEALQTLNIAIPTAAAPESAALLRLEQQLLDRLARIPGVTATALMAGLPMSGYSSQDPISASDHTYAANQIPPLRRFLTVGPGTFATLGVPLIAGRELTWTDLHERRNVVLISENFAREYWGSAAAALGRQIRSNPTDPWREIIGVVGDIRHDGVDKPAPTSVYWPARESYGLTYLVRGPRAGLEAYTSEIRNAIREVVPAAPVTGVRTLREVRERSMARTAFTLTLLAISGIMALLLAAVGIYAVISYAVAQRTREMGIRIALGAQSGSLKLLFVRDGLLWGGIGAAAGLAGAVALSRLLSSLLFAISPLDPLTYVLAALSLLGVAALASYLPARRVTRIDPMVALRAD